MPFIETSALGADSSPADAPLFDALVEPNDSLGDGGFAVFLIAILAILCIVEMVVLASGAWIVGLFFAGDALFLVLAMKLFRMGRNTSERITIVNGVVRIARHDGKREMTNLLMVYGLGLERDDDPDYGCLGLWLRLRARRIEVGRDLSPHERAHFGDRLEAALRAAGGRARAERRVRAQLLPLAVREA